jgi:hypothetical protein
MFNWLHAYGELLHIQIFQGFILTSPLQRSQHCPELHYGRLIPVPFVHPVLASVSIFLDSCSGELSNARFDSNPLGFMPSCNGFDRYIEESEKVLKKECKTLLEYAASAYKFIFFWME